VTPETVNTLREGVRNAYSAAASNPSAKHPFPVGRDFACSLGYPTELLEQVPANAVEAFAGVANVSCFAPLPERGRVLDLGCGSGFDSLVFSVRANHQTPVCAVDFSAEMLARGRRASQEIGAPVTFVQASAEEIPLPDDSVDVAMVNGIFNLNPAREALFFELARVLRPGGVVAGAELVLSEALPIEAEPSPESWFS
jgi:arsenite methyltransferase